MTKGELRERLREKRANRPKRMVPPSIPPRYDERFVEITRLLNEDQEAPHVRSQDADVRGELVCALVPGGDGLGGDLVGDGGLDNSVGIQESEGAG